MPNHVINEIIFRDIPESQIDAILAKTVSGNGAVDFEVLLPLSLNFWPGNVSEKHKRFPGTHLDEAREVWGTKWNAYGQKDGAVTREPRTLILRFQTAWSPPFGWLMAIFNTFKLRFEHNWLDEGAGRGWSGVFDYARLNEWGAGGGWIEEPADEQMQRRLHKLLWGVEEFEESDVGAPHV